MKIKVKNHASKHWRFVIKYNTEKLEENDTLIPTNVVFEEWTEIGKNSVNGSEHFVLAMVDDEGNYDPFKIKIVKQVGMATPSGFYATKDLAAKEAKKQFQDAMLVCDEKITHYQEHRKLLEKIMEEV